MSEKNEIMSSQGHDIRLLDFNSPITELTIGDLVGLIGSMATAIIGQLKPELLNPPPAGRIEDSELLQKATNQIMEALRGREANRPEERAAATTAGPSNPYVAQGYLDYMKMLRR
jgi:hypothetical protein